MQACENVIVTVRLESEQIDMELPVFLEIKDLSIKILEAFRVMRPEKYALCDSICLSFWGERLDLQRNLASYGIWDASIISCVIE